MAADGTTEWRTGRTVAGVLGLAFSGVYLLEGRTLDFGTMDAPGPGIFPLAVGILMAVVSLGVIAEARTTREPGKLHLPAGYDATRLLSVFTALVVFVLALSVLGLPIAAFLFVAFYVRLVGRVTWAASVLSGAGVAIGVYVVFEVLLGVRLPDPVWA
ncbi:tripartite tricarboxylate transporter TctB family protein [Roseitranquillus sediminis]|uniref:tripartite tricarboxylate transporter TctB family protein n=1 Tax=Roseitranquillus sediminis TaxID=2809051 RepID=UPI001D0C8822|nr:tripartite tricarboxylate transporter TctB family protein [Roseitranquillus sediminis]MBM9593161.1 tripartite tricarboxylate transporter TctB family protein [Roseitranquillus sediminis]